MENDDQGKRLYTYEEALEFLSDQEVKVLKLVGQSLTCKRIAGILHISEETAYTHRRNIKRKLNLNGHKSLEQWCWDNHDAMYGDDSDTKNDTR